MLLVVPSSMCYSHSLSVSVFQELIRSYARVETPNGSADRPQRLKQPGEGRGSRKGNHWVEEEQELLLLRSGGGDYANLFNKLPINLHFETNN